MSHSPMQLEPERMLGHARGLRSALRSLGIDDHSAEDVMQETWLRAIQRPPRDEAALGPWLRTVASRLARRVKNRDHDRVRHEERAACDERVPSAADTLEREQQKRGVIDAVLELREPYRAAILHRYLQNQTPQQVAERLALPLETVRTRIKRGLAQLRASFDA